MTSTPILVQTNVRKSTADDLPANQALLHCLATSDGDTTYHRDEPFTLTSKELQTVHNTALTNHFQWAAQRDEIHSRPSKDSMVLQYNRGRDDSHQDIIVTLYDGPKQGLDALNDMGYGEVICSKKTPDNDTSAASDTDDQMLPPLESYSSSKFERSWLSASQENSSNRCRWFKVLHVKDAPADTNWSQILATLHQNIDTAATKADWVNKVRLCHLSVKISHKIIYMQQLEQCGNNTVRDSEISTSTGIPLRSIKQLAGLNKISFPASLHDIQDEHSFSGADLISGTQRSFRTDKHDNLYIVEKPRTALVFRDQPYTLADIVVQRHQHQVALLQSRDGIAMLNKEFRQVKVSARVGKQTENRTIAGFREGRATDAPLTLRHYAWSLKGEAFGLSDLPSVNVGTHDKPLLLPLELCTVLPSQRLRGPIDASLSRMVESRRPNIISQFNSYSKATGLVVVPSPLMNNDDTLNEKIVRACGRGFPNILFVEASSLSVESRNWVALQDSVRELIKTSLEEHSEYQQRIVVPTDQKRLLRLRYDSDAGLIDKWTEQLRQFTTLHSGSEGQQTFVIVYLPAESRHAEMYKIIKKACDITVGVQTFFVNHARLESRVCGLSTAGVLKAAAELRSRICLRNPRISLATTTKKGTPQAKRFVIAMHVSPVTFPSKSRIASGHVTKLYMVALVMSELETGSYLRTEVKLYNAEQVKNLDMATMFAPFARSLPSTGRHYLTILRSGHPPERRSEPNMSDAQSSAPTATRTPAEDEFAGICRAFSPMITPAECNYITLREDKVLCLRVDTANLTLPALVIVKSTQRMDKDQMSFRATHVHSKSTSTGAIAMTLLCAQGSATASNVIAKPVASSHIQTSPSKQRPANNNSGKSPTRKPLSPYNTGGRQTRQHATSGKGTETPSKMMAREDAESQFEGSFVSATDVPLPPDLIEFDENATVATQQLAEMTLKDTEHGVEQTGDTDAQALAELWDGHELGLTGTKWPIVTHLAHLAVKRALLHLDSNDWDGTEAKGKATAPFFLPPVNDKVRNSLYYL